jgi:hypothetical protein
LTASRTLATYFWFFRFNAKKYYTAWPLALFIPVKTRENLDHPLPKNYHNIHGEK